MENKWPALRMVHCLGGVRLLNSFGPTVEVSTLSIVGRKVEFQVKDYPSLYKAISQLNLLIIGVDFYEDSSQIEDDGYPSWRPYCYHPYRTWEHEEADRIWQNISTGAHKAQIGHLWDLASRISNQLRVCSWRIREISNLYNVQLDSQLRKKEFSIDCGFYNKQTWQCYTAIQSYLIEACILRDYLSEYAAHFVFSELLEDGKNISALSGFKKLVLSKSCNDNLFIELKNITSTGGWLKQLGEYRDLVTHSTPLATAEKRLVVFQKQLPTQFGNMPFISCPLPQDPGEISSSRIKRGIFKDFEKLLDRTSFMRPSEKSMDGLIYCHSSLSQLSDLANKLAARSPVKPEILTLTEKDISNFRIVNE